MCHGHDWHRVVAMVGSVYWNGHDMGGGMMTMTVGITVIRRHMVAVTLVSIGAQQVSVLAVAVVGILVMGTVTVVAVAVSANDTVSAMMIVATVGSTVSLMSATVSFGR